VGPDWHPGNTRAPASARARAFAMGTSTCARLWFRHPGPPSSRPTRSWQRFSVAWRGGKQKAIVAVAHKILVIIYTLLKTGQVDQERGATALDERQKDRIVHRLERRIAQLGYTVRLEPITAAAPGT